VAILIISARASGFGSPAAQAKVAVANATKHATAPGLRYPFEILGNRERVLGLSIRFSYWILIRDRLGRITF
jgi:hypothetical protein